ncbi:two-component system chemotaxis response regulator CheY [Orenia metallireducens]|uniref:Stage 0 sporulation protein A homolog n=1 Tax=Orenia metallireducens TaxID=1413210 RepID=A0A285GQ27_9FIRM|nr:response regulator [Orenia metallireducens]PRX29902.1 two-component system chemotaxis response regulator CheY [Orenia metallireducens]SNY25575.1 two-component system, chemotaxis family, response regulator CheY [Orenia metallireducens]
MSKSVLIVDDAQFMRTMLGKLIEENGYEVAGEAINGEEAIQKYMDLSPDLVTMDITMPKMDGVEATKQILAFNPEAKVVMCSAMGQKPMVVESLKAGAKDFIVKPIKPNKVKDALKNILG